LKKSFKGGGTNNKVQRFLMEKPIVILNISPLDDHMPQASASFKKKCNLPGLHSLKIE
jgi:hypothetical protein